MTGHIGDVLVEGKGMMRMFTRLSHVAILVKDQDEALKWYTEKLGLEKRMDAPMGEGRWLTVGVPGQKGIEIVLAKPCAESSPERLEELNGLIGKSPMFAFDTSDCRKTYDELVSRGVTFSKPPEEAEWGVFAMFEDLYGNLFVLAEPHTVTPGVPVEEQAVCSCEG
jgi:predicted enzyme related to lactoylglutathione lyase